jgi:prepilin-type N-terminal cleavage/methylation domain-containing protein
MASLKISTYNAQSSPGFTLVEVLTVVAILAILSGISLFATLTTYRNDALNAEAATITLLLESARTEAFDNVDQCPHGVRISSEGFTLFEGAAFNDTHCDRSLHQYVPATYGISVTSDPVDVVFQQLSAEANDSSITINDHEHAHAPRRMHINREGMIQ